MFVRSEPISILPHKWIQDIFICVKTFFPKKKSLPSEYYVLPGGTKRYRYDADVLCVQYCSTWYSISQRSGQSEDVVTNLVIYD